jgi:hypothetical protein
LLLLIGISVTGLGSLFPINSCRDSPLISWPYSTLCLVIVFLIWIPVREILPHHPASRANRCKNLPHGRNEARHGEMQIHWARICLQLHIDDLKIVTKELGFDFTLQDGSSTWTTARKENVTDLQKHT